VAASVAAGTVILMTVTSATLTMRAESSLQAATAGLLLATSALSLFLLFRGRLLRWLRSPIFPPSFRVLGGMFCLAVALITTLALHPPFLSFSQLNAAWLLLFGFLLLVTVLADWSQWRRDRA
jgi:hypothetical protein